MERWFLPLGVENWNSQWRPVVSLEKPQKMVAIQSLWKLQQNIAKFLQ